MESKKLHALSVTVVALAVMVGGWYLYAYTLGRPYLDGELEHDFGTVWLDDLEKKVSHTFKLVNRTNEIIEGAVIFKQITSEVLSPLVFYIDLPTKQTDGNDFVIVWNSSGIATFSV